MALFNRKKPDTPVLPEIERYYDAEKRERAGMAWFLAIVSIACVALLLIGMYFGGRWVYRKAAHTDKTTGVSTTKITGSDIAKPKTNNTPTDTTVTKPPTPAPSTPTAVTPQAPAAQTPATTPVATTPSTLVNTGPTSTVAIFIASVSGFAFLHNLLARRRQTN